MRGARADLYIVGLKQGAALMIPVVLQTQNNLLKSEHEGVNAVMAVELIILAWGRPCWWRAVGVARFEPKMKCLVEYNERIAYD